MAKQPQLGTPNEEWLPIVGYEGWYEVSSQGRVRRVKVASNTHAGFILRPRPDRDGYAHLQLNRYGKGEDRRVHRLVAEAFLGPCPPGHETNHINGIKADNRPANLEWATASVNSRHARSSGLAHSLRGGRDPMAKLTDADVLAIRAAHGKVCGVALARQYSVAGATISRIQHHKRWAHLP